MERNLGLIGRDHTCGIGMENVPVEAMHQAFGLFRQPFIHMVTYLLALSLQTELIERIREMAKIKIELSFQNNQVAASYDGRKMWVSTYDNYFVTTLQAILKALPYVVEFLPLKVQFIFQVTTVTSW
jgi:hypothetical protein